ncbi:hypothetical protein GQ53DRAFT_830103 [Thozetella sp. PMI_491]|nr:hypothetical protein GQ53DRAFT_830103 [Thozetella sp. PMI_491]
MSSTNFFGSSPPFGWTNADAEISSQQDLSDPFTTQSHSLDDYLAPTSHGRTQEAQGQEAGTSVVEQTATTNPEVEALPETLRQDSNQAPRIEQAANPARRTKYGSLNWEQHRDEMRIIYLDENKSLADTMRIMRGKYNFEASTKLYKDKFKEWGWQKNLPTKIALFMTDKAKKRKRDKGKETIFTYRERPWTKARAESTLTRAKKAKGLAEQPDAVTPEGVSYKTPKTVVLSPENGAVEDAEDEDEDEDHEVVVDIVDESDDDSSTIELPLSYKGLSRVDLLAMWELARSGVQGSVPDEKERLLLQVLDGLSYLQGATNEETNKVAYALADLYVQAGRGAEGDKVLERQTQAHINAFGFAHRKTKQHVLQVVELLNGWNRQEDALGLLSRAREMQESIATRQSGVKVTAKEKRRQPKTTDNVVANTSRMVLSEVTASVSSDPTPARLDYGLSVARSAVLSCDEDATSLLLEIIRQCKLNLPQLTAQLLRAMAELLSQYQKLGIVDTNRNTFQEAQARVLSVCETHSWDSENFMSFQVLEAALQLVANLVKCGYKSEGKALFRKLHDTAFIVFGPADKRTVWALISIGLVFQTHTTWDDAEEWFEAAFAASLASMTLGLDDGIVKSLQKAINRHHFEYVNDEGRPYKTVFGVTGLTITPIRLHLE